MIDRSEAKLLAGLFIVSFLIFLVLFSSIPVLFDSDSFFHLAVARQYLAQGFSGGLSWARLSIMHDGFGDKEFLFHCLLIPFAAIKDPMSGGFLALAFFNAAIVTALALAALPAGRVLALATPLLLYAAASNFTIRCLALRPELLSLLLLVGAAVAAAHRRYRLLGLLALVYTLSYTAFHVFFGLCVLWFLAQWLSAGASPARLQRLVPGNSGVEYCGQARRPVPPDTVNILADHANVREKCHTAGTSRTKLQGIPSPAAVAWPLAGTAAGILLHPHFPQSLKVWYYQNISFFMNKSLLDVGTEIYPPRAKEVLLLNGGWILGMALVLFLSGRAREPAPGTNERWRNFAIATAVFGALFLFMQRFALYFFPFATLSIILARRGFGGNLSRNARVVIVAGVLATGLASYATLRQVNLFLHRSGVFLEGRREDWEAIGPLLPPGARVAAPWIETGFYVLWAPQAVYLNVLDPVFMVVKHPAAYRAQRMLFAGAEPDVPLRLLTDLQSDFLVFSLLSEDRRALLQRLEADPRIRRLKAGINPVYAVQPGHNKAFVLDWAVEESGGGGSMTYPRRTDPREAAVEGYVDARQLEGPPRERVFVHAATVAAPVRIEYELASYGPFTLLVDGRETASSNNGAAAVLGRGVVVPVTFTLGTHTLTVRLVPQPDGQGFYLRELSRTPLTSTP